jgi:two-component system sensor histidine kinase UhpB
VVSPAFAGIVDDGAASAARGGASSAERSDSGPHLLSATAVAGAFVVVSALLALLLFLVPSRAVAATRREMELSMRERAVAFREEDRRRIARELHDGAGQALTAAHLQLEAMRQSSSAPETVDLVIGLVQEAMGEIRHSTAALAPPALAELGLGPALVRHCEVFSAATRVAFKCDLVAALPPLSAELEIACYRMAQEAMQNVARHAGATAASVRVTVVDDALLLEVEDNGTGVELREEGEELALKSIRERAALVNAEVRLERGAHAGLRLCVRAPLSSDRVA